MRVLIIDDHAGFRRMAHKLLARSGYERLLLNNQLTDFAQDPAAANGWAPGKRPRSSMSPTIVVESGRPVLATGGAGGPSIILATLQSVVSSVDFGLDPARAPDAERVDTRGVRAAGELGLCVERHGSSRQSCSG